MRLRSIALFCMDRDIRRKQSCIRHVDVVSENGVDEVAIFKSLSLKVEDFNVASRQ